MKRRFVGMGLLALLALLLLVGCGSSNDTNTANTSTGPVGASSGATPIATGAQPTKLTVSAGLPTVGKAYHVSETWTVTVNSVTKSQGDPYNAPKAGQQFLVVNVTMKNTSQATQNVSSMLMFSLSDSTGQKASVWYLSSAGAAPEGPVTAGGLLRGEIVYIVPTSEHHLEFRFQPDFMSNELTEWKLTV